MNIAIVGYDREGQASYTYLAEQGHQLTICDQKTDITLPDGAKSQLGAQYLHGLDRFDMIVRTPGLHPGKILAQNPDVGDKITSGTNLFFENCPSQNIIGVTGTKGKGTTSSLIAAMLRADGKTVHLLGNIGIPMLGALASIQPSDWVVLELSNFQLIDARYSPPLAVVLMIMQEHLDWHEDFEEYIAAKQQICIHQTADDTVVYYAKNDVSLSVADASEGMLLPFYDKPGAEVVSQTIVIDGTVICTTEDIGLIGDHNLQNVCAAVTTVWHVTHNVDAIRSTVKTFHGLPFRIELRRELHGVQYYNDSFASNPGATTAALEAIPQQKVMIIGGFDRQLALDELVSAIRATQTSIRKIILIGASAERTATALHDSGFTNFIISTAQTMEEIVNLAQSHALPGDAVVLSPSFPSFDMFKDFEDRGRQFNQAVEHL